MQILETVRDKVPPEVFTTPYSNPVGGNPEAVRANLRESTRLLKEAGFEIRDRKLVDAAGKPVTRRDSVQDPADERIALFYKPSLERLGVTTVDPHRRRCAVSEPAAQFRFRYHHRRLGAVAFARQRATRFLGVAGGGSARLDATPRHQESGRRCADRQGDLRQGSRRTGGRDQGAGPRVAVEFLRGAAIHLLGFHATRAGTASAIPSRCRNTAVPACRPCGGGTPKRPPG